MQVGDLYRFEGRPYSLSSLDGRIAVYLGEAFIHRDDGVTVQNHQVLEFRDVRCDGVAQVKLALLIKLHQRDAGNRLGHGVDAVDCVLTQRNLLFHIAQTVCRRIDELTVLHQHRLNPCDLAGFNIASQPLIECRKALFAEPRAFG